MASGRRLPERRNPMLDDAHAPQYEILVERRCLGQTELKVKPGQIGTTNATKPDNLGVLEYCHLRAPLPKDLTGSGLFAKGPNRKWPEAYFLMRRSSDGYVSATGMFKAAFPYAQHEDEEAEKQHLKTMANTSSEEIAGNLWVTPDQALELAEEYGISRWIQALLDPEPITHGVSPGKVIRSPPPYYSKKEMANGAATTTEKVEGRASTRGRRSASVRSEDPEVTAPTTKTPARPKATPRKPRKGRSALSKLEEGEGSGSVEPEDDIGVNGKLETVPETVTVEVETVERPGKEETTSVSVTMPVGHSGLALPEDPKQMLAEARKMVEEAREIDGPSRSKGKRKLEEFVEEEEEIEMGPPLPAKRARKLEVELRKERIKRRALVGIAGSLAIGAVIPAIVSFFGA